MTALQSLALAGALFLLLAAAAATGTFVATWLADRDDRAAMARSAASRASRRAGRRRRHHATPVVVHEPDAAIRLPALDVVYQPGVTVLPALGGDPTYEQTDPTRVDLLAEHVERARRWRQ